MSQQPPNVPRPEFLHPAIVRPDRMGRPHPDPRADPPTQRLDLGEGPTDRLPLTGPDTEPIPTVAPEVVERPAGDGGRRGACALTLRPVIGSLAGFLSRLIAAPGGTALRLVAIGLLAQVVCAAAVSVSPGRRRVDVEVPRL